MKHFYKYLFSLFFILSCKSLSNSDVIGEYKNKKNSTIVQFKNKILYSKNGIYDVKIFNKLLLKSNYTFEYQGCFATKEKKGIYKIEQDSVKLFFDNGEKINLKIGRNKLYNIEKTDSVNIIYNLVKVK